MEKTEVGPYQYLNQFTSRRYFKYLRRYRSVTQKATQTTMSVLCRMFEAIHYAIAVGPKRWGFYPIDIYQNFEMIFRNWYHFLSSRRRDLKLYWYCEDKLILHDSSERKSWALIGKIYRLQLHSHLRFDASKLRIFYISQQFVPL